MFSKEELMELEKDLKDLVFLKYDNSNNFKRFKEKVNLWVYRAINSQENIDLFGRRILEEIFKPDADEYADLLDEWIEPYNDLFDKIFEVLHSTLNQSELIDLLKSELEHPEGKMILMTAFEKCLEDFKKWKEENYDKA